MENTEEDVDDQSSGWFQVKKRHRRFSIQSWVGGFTAKSSSNLLNSPLPLNDKGGSSHGKFRSNLQKARGDISIHDQGSSANSAAVSSKDEKAVYHRDRCVDKLDAKRTKMPPSFGNDCNGESGNNPELQSKSKLHLVHKFKWGALDDDDLVLHHQNNHGAEIRFGDIGDGNLLACKKLENNSDIISCRSSTSSCYHYSSSSSSASNIQQTLLVATKVDLGVNSIVSTHKDKIIGETCKDVDEKIIEQNDGVSDCKEMCNEDLKEMNDNYSSSCYAGEVTDMVAKLETPIVVSEVEGSRISEVPLTYGVPNMEVSSQCTESLTPEKCGHEVFGGLISTASVGSSRNLRDGTVCNDLLESHVEIALQEGEIPEKSGPEVFGGSTVTASVGDLRDPQDGVIHGDLIQSQSIRALGEAETAKKSGLEVSGKSAVTSFVGDFGDPQDGTIHNLLSKPQIMSALGDGETAESKERFRQRLWCFLFENLNRAIDELYLLCELECDLEQMKEAILVLEEAASDFKELSSRVKEFENSKKFSSQSIDGAPITLKTDHRRPHALSWEVRRMTTSPHRAEILASSLEAFRKIQQERASLRTDNNAKTLGLEFTSHHLSGDNLRQSAIKSDSNNLGMKSRKLSGSSNLSHESLTRTKQKIELGMSAEVNIPEVGRDLPKNSSSSDVNSAGPPLENNCLPSGVAKNKREHLGSDTEKLVLKKDKMLTESIEKNLKSIDHLKKQGPVSEKDKEKRNVTSWKTMDAWKEKRNWEDVLSSPFRASSRISHSPGMSRKSAERARILHQKLMSPEKKKKNALDLKKEAEEKHARAMRIRSQLENERVQKLQRTSEKLNRVNEWQAVRSMKLREGMYARHQRSESRHEAYLAQVVRRAGDESSKVNEVRFITSLNEENKKLMLRQKLHDSELRRAEKLQVMKIKQKEEMAREEAVLERRRLIEAEKLQRLAETQRKKEEAQVRREEERKASSAAREARAIEQLRRKEERAKAQQEEAELLAQKLAERLSESEQRRKFYLEQIRERASMDFRDQSSPLLRRAINKEGQGRTTPPNSGDDDQANGVACSGRSTLATGDGTLQHSVKRRIKRIRQRLMAMKYEFSEPPAGFENVGIGFRTAVGTAREKIARWVQELKRLRQARKEGAASIGLISAEMIKFLEGKEAELQASRQAGLLDFIASALPASHTSKPEACQVTIHLLKLLRVVLSAPANRSYFLAQNLLPPLIPMLSAALENYIKIAASLNVPGSANLPLSKTSVENFESISEVLDGFLWTVTTIIGHITSDDRQLQMRDGLLELLIAYQVIHRLRDLFALYDRPQVEGSPFPSTILLSIHMLVVLTSRPGACAFIDWQSLAKNMLPGNESQQEKFAEPADSGYFYVNDAFVDHRPPLSVINGTSVIPPPDVPDDRLSDNSCRTNENGELVSTDKDNEKKLAGNPVELNNASMDDAEVSDESQRILFQKKDERTLVDIGAESKNEDLLSVKQQLAFLLSAISETGLVSLPSLLTSVLLQANNKSSSEQASYALPSNFEEVATGVLKVLNNLALLDITFMQNMLARPDLKMEFFHLMSFLLSHCTSKWRAATDQVGLLLLEALLLLGYFALFHSGNQAVLRWGKSPTILHKVCDLPFVFFSDPDLMPILAGTLVTACYGCEQNKAVVQQELSLDMLLSLLKSCRNALPAVRSNSILEDLPAENSSESNQQGPECKKWQSDVPSRSSRYNGRSTRVSLGKSAASGSSFRVGKTRNQRDNRATKPCEETIIKHSLPAFEASVMLHCRFPSSFIDRAEQFFSTEIPDVGEEVMNKLQWSSSQPANV